MIKAEWNIKTTQTVESDEIQVLATASFHVHENGDTAVRIRGKQMAEWPPG
jgi:hypothetical protein